MSKYKDIYLFFSILICMASCSQKKEVHLGTPVMPPENILNGINSLWDYHNKYLKLSEEYISLDTNLKPIAKKDFLNQVITGKYLPLRLISDDTAYYQLYSIGKPKDDNIPTLLYTIGTFAYKNYLLEQQMLPSFNFTDLEGNKYTAENTIGKIVVFKCWFIHCKTCIEEMPLLNKMKENYKQRNDIIFASLAMDKTDDLKKFLATKRFNWATIPDQKDYLRKTLDIIAFPTYIIVNKKGVISKVVQGYSELAVALANEYRK